MFELAPEPILAAGSSKSSWSTIFTRKPRRGLPREPSFSRGSFRGERGHYGDRVEARLAAASLAAMPLIGAMGSYAEKPITLDSPFGGAVHFLARLIVVQLTTG